MRRQRSRVDGDQREKMKKKQKKKKKKRAGQTGRQAAGEKEKERKRESAPLVMPGGSATVKAVAEGRFEPNFYGAPAWASFASFSSSPSVSLARAAARRISDTSLETST